MEISRLSWPREAASRAELAETNSLRILLVDSNAPTPDVLDLYEDWVRLPASEDDIVARERKLLALVGAGHIEQDSDESISGKPRLDDHGLLWVGNRWRSVPPVEAAITAMLLANLGNVVSRDDLAKAAWPGEQAARNALDVRILRLRRRIDPLGLVVRTIRSQGYLLENVPGGANESQHEPTPGTD